MTSPLRWDRWDWLYASGAVAAVFASHHYDVDVRDHFIYTNPIDLEDSHSKQDALPTVAVMAGTFVVAWIWDDPKGYRETRNMVEAGVFSGVSALVAKQLIPRERPNGTSDSSAWGQGSSFPSTHVTIAAAVGTVLAESGNDDLRWVRRTFGYGLIAGTAYLRLKHNQHWLSDTVAGAGLGISTARFVLNLDQPHETQSSLMVVPIDGGISLNYMAAFR